MRTLLLTLTLAALAAFFVAVGSAGKSGSCSVSPDPSPADGVITVSGSGLAPDSVYGIWITQAGNQVPGAHPNVRWDTDGNGDLSLDWDLAGDVYGPYLPGQVDVNLRKKGLPRASCSFDVG